MAFLLRDFHDRADRSGFARDAAGMLRRDAATPQGDAGIAGLFTQIPSGIAAIARRSSTIVHCVWRSKRIQQDLAARWADSNSS